MKKEGILSKYPQTKDNILLILHDLQNNNPRNYLTEEDLNMVANYLNLSYSTVYGIANYYSMFSLNPRGKFVIRVCSTHICEMQQELTVLEGLKSELGIDVNQTTPDGLFTLELSECLGHCSEPSVIMINREVYTNLTSENVKEIIKKLRKENK